MTSPVAISVVVCAYTIERWGDIVACIASLQRQTAKPHEILLIVDHNDSLFAAAKAKFPTIRVKRSEGPRGLSGARNSGIEAAQGDVVAFLDDDASAADDWIERLGAPFADPLVLGVGGKIRPAWQGARPFWFPEEFDWVVGCSYRGMPEDRRPVRNIMGANMSFRRDALQAIGGFDASLGRGGGAAATGIATTRILSAEETELCIRALQRWPEGLVVYEPAAVVFHQVPASRGRSSYFGSRCYAEGLSKARMTRLVGQRQGLASERAYTREALPRGVARAFVDVVQGDVAGGARAVAIVAGLAMTIAGYGIGMAFGPRDTLATSGV